MALSDELTELLRRKRISRKKAQKAQRKTGKTTARFDALKR
jgi:hypothetical protein